MRDPPRDLELANGLSSELGRDDVIETSTSERPRGPNVLVATRNFNIVMVMTSGIRAMRYLPSWEYGIRTLTKRNRDSRLRVNRGVVYRTTIGWIQAPASTRQAPEAHGP